MGKFTFLGYIRHFKFSRKKSTDEKGCQTNDKKPSVTFSKPGSPGTRIQTEDRKDNYQDYRPFEFSTHRFAEGDYYQEESVSQVKSEWNDVENVIEGYLEGENFEEPVEFVPQRKKRTEKARTRREQEPPINEWNRTGRRQSGSGDEGLDDTIATDIDINSEIRNYMDNHYHNGHVICDPRQENKSQESTKKPRMRQSGNQTMSFYFRKQEPVEYTFYVDDLEKNKDTLLGRGMNAIMRQTGCQFIMYESSPDDPSFYKGRPVLPITVIAPHLSALKKCIGRIESSFPNFNAKAFLAGILV